jgi:hypothetical protein
MRTKKDIQMLLESGLSSAFVANLNDSQMKSLVERFGKNKKEETKEQSTTPQNTTPVTTSSTSYIVKPNSKTMINGVEVDTTGGKTSITPLKELDEEETLDVVNDPDATADGMPTTEGVIKEKFESKAQQGFFWAKCNTSKGVKKKKWCELAREFSDSTSKKQYKTMPEKKNPEKMDEEYEKFLEDRIVEMIESRIQPKMTKADILKTISEKMEKNNSMILRNPKKMSMFAHESGIESKRMKKPTQMMPVMGTMEENETKEKERTKEKDAPTKPGTTPKRRGNPFKNPNPGVKEDPRGQKKSKEDMKKDFIGLINQVL